MEVKDLQLTVARLKRRLVLRERELATARRHLKEEQSEERKGEIVQKSLLPFDLYTALVNRVRATVHQCISPGAHVLVISKGDPDLTTFAENRVGLHYPQDEQGVYAGHYPASSSAAIDHLEELRAKGAQFLVVPASAFWWLQHYGEFDQHLRTHYPKIGGDEETCAIFDLHQPAIEFSAPEPGTLKVQQFTNLLLQIQQIVRFLLPLEARVLVLSRGNPDLLALGTTIGSHFPHDGTGAYAGQPADSGEAITLLQKAKTEGYKYLLIPSSAQWWLTYYVDFARYLHQECRSVLDQPQACSIFAL